MDILAIKKYNIYIQKDLQCGKRLKQRGKTPMIWQKKPWKQCWESFKETLLNFIAALATFVWGIIQLVFQTLVAFIKSVGIILFGWLIDWVKRW